MSKRGQIGKRFTGGNSCERGGREGQEWWEATGLRSMVDTCGGRGAEKISDSRAVLRPLRAV